MKVDISVFLGEYAVPARLNPDAAFMQFFFDIFKQVSLANNRQIHF